MLIEALSLYLISCSTMTLEHKEKKKKKGEKNHSTVVSSNKYALIENITIWIDKRMQTITTGSSTSCNILHGSHIMLQKPIQWNWEGEKWWIIKKKNLTPKEKNLTQGTITLCRKNLKIPTNPWKFPLKTLSRRLPN